MNFTARPETVSVTGPMSPAGLQEPAGAGECWRVLGFRPIVCNRTDHENQRAEPRRTA